MRKQRVQSGFPYRGRRAAALRTDGKLNRKRLKMAGGALLAAALLGLCGCSQPAADGETAGETAVQEAPNLVEKETASLEDFHLRDKPEVYADDDETSVVTMYLTVRQGNEAEHTNHTWEEINTYSKYYYEDRNIPQYAVEGILQVGDENGPLKGELGYGLDTPNAIVKIRGQTSTKSAQKNYKIELKKEKGTWRDQRTINLNKHFSDGLRFRNKLAYDLMKDIPQMVGARTQFVHLYVKDETAGEQSVFEDYGLFTQVEQVNKQYLKSRDFDKNGHLYKINFFEFLRYEDAVTLATDVNFDQKAFETHLEIKGDNDHTKLITMLEELNDYSIPIEETAEKWFDLENLFYWMGFHILMGNLDTNARNYFLYSPLNVNKFYIISWDNDASLKETENSLKTYNDGADWNHGISNYWGNVLYSRLFKNEEYRNMLTEIIGTLRSQYLTKEKLTEKIAGYRQVTKQYIYQMPDLMYARLTEAEFDMVADALPGEIDENYRLYMESLEKPMPFYIGVPVKEDGKLKIVWDAAYDFDSENITYSFELASDYTFENMIYRDENVRIPQVELDMLPAGQYFIRVRAANESGKTQSAFDYYVTDYGKASGIKCFYILEDGSIEEDVFDEGA